MRTIDADALVAQWEVGAEQVEDVIAKMFIQAAIHDVKHAPTIGIEQQWIPCSERLPEPERRGQRRAWFLTTNEYGSVGECKYEFYDDTFGIGWDSDIRVVAWMPLPTPYKEDDTEGR